MSNFPDPQRKRSSFVPEKGDDPIAGPPCAFRGSAETQQSNTNLSEVYTVLRRCTAELTGKRMLQQHMMPRAILKKLSYGLAGRSPGFPPPARFVPPYAASTAWSTSCSAISRGFVRAASFVWRPGDWANRMGRASSAQAARQLRASAGRMLGVGGCRPMHTLTTEPRIGNGANGCDNSFEPRRKAG